MQKCFPLDETDGPYAGGMTNNEKMSTKPAGCLNSLEKYQVGIYLGAIIGGLLVTPRNLEWLLTPVLGLLMLSTFAALPLQKIRPAPRLTAIILGLNFVVVPAVIAVLTIPLRAQPVLLAGVVMVLLAPCIDYVVPFSGLAGAANDRLLTITPVLFIVQLAVLMVVLPLIIGHDFAATALWPIIRSVLFLLVIPLVIVWIMQKATRSTHSVVIARLGRNALLSCEIAMVPLMVLTLFAITATYGARVLHNLNELVPVLVIYALFAAIMVVIGVTVAKHCRLGAKDGIATIFSGVTRNSLVIMPIALALPAGFEAVPMVIVGQTLVELCVMVALIKSGPYLRNLLQ